MRATLALLSLIAANPAGAVELHYAPLENLQRLDLQKLNTARKTVDIAASSLTDWPITGALTAAAYRGVKVRLFVDGVQAGTEGMSPAGPFGKLLSAPHVVVKQKRVGSPPMRLNAYCIDGRIFRTGSAAFTPSNLTQQDTDLLFFDDAHMCSDFTITFDELWTGKNAE